MADYGHRIGDCRNLSYGQIWEKFRDRYAGDIKEQDLLEIHRRWRRIGKQLRQPGGVITIK